MVSITCGMTSLRFYCRKHTSRFVDLQHVPVYDLAPIISTSLRQSVENEVRKFCIEYARIVCEHVVPGGH